MRRSIITFLLVISSSLIFPQESVKDSLDASGDENTKNVNFRLMPYGSYNRNLKFMLGVMPMMMYKMNKKDDVSPKSFSGLAAVYTTNSSYFITFFNRLFIDEDKWRVTLVGLTGDHNSQFFLEDQIDPGFYDFGTKTTIISADVQRNISKSFYLGLGYRFSSYESEFEDDVQEPTDTQTNGVELTSLYDTRNAIYYPKKGIKTTLKWLTIPKWFGNDISANRIKAEYNQYFAMNSERDVIAARVSGTFGLGDIVFEQQVTIGGKDIRGYSLGTFRGDGLMAIQGEYRFNFHEKMGVVGFAGFSTIYGSENPEFDWKFYPGFGAGYRYKVFEDENFNIGIDAAIGRDDWGIYFRIGEAF